MRVDQKPRSDSDEGIYIGVLMAFHRESNICLWEAIKSPSEILLDAAHLALLLARLRLDPQKFDSETASVFSAQDDPQRERLRFSPLRMTDQGRGGAAL